MIYYSFKLRWALFFFLLVTLFKINNVFSKRKRKTYVKNVKWYPQRINHYYINGVVFPRKRRRLATFFVFLGNNGKKKNKRNYKFNIKSKLNVEGENKNEDDQKNEGDQKNEDNNNNNNNNQNNNNNNNNQNNNNYNNNNYNSPNQEQCDDIKTKQYVKDNVENNKKIDEQQNCCKESYNEDKEKNNHNCIDGIYTEDIITKKKKCNNDNITEEGENMNVQNLESLQNDGNGVIELGCGLGQISKYLFSKYKNMTGIEIDSRALSIISRTMPGFDFIHDDVLQINYKELSINKKTKLTIIGNLPFYITSQILFCLLDFHKYIEQAIVTIQYEVGERIVAKPNQKNYSILSILFHLFTYPYLLFKIPSKAFYPVPKVQAAVMKIIFKNHESYYKHINCNLLFLKKILKYSFQQRRKKLKSSLKNLLIQYNIPKLPEQFINLRPQQLYPYQFVELTNLLFPLQNYPFNPNIHTKVWRKKKHGD
ncbi:dimethyladenosine transferase [Plasmodium falciparum UGT5.1]|uniref:rRNA adenine N(6)-methyltransferase n=1 Tax=Plasmodium falciparum UGT5.1 TaxID=1237627 RepID=W7JJI1_PLAFA|nr:dimethyladenosine transferase [Plasmodium falciparum UGT5.1]